MVISDHFPRKNLEASQPFINGSLGMLPCEIREIGFSPSETKNHIQPNGRCENSQTRKPIEFKFMSKVSGSWNNPFETYVFLKIIISTWLADKH